MVRASGFEPSVQITFGHMALYTTEHMMGVFYSTLNIIDEYTRETLMIRVDRKLNSTDIVDALTDLFILRGASEYIWSDNAPEFIAKKVCDWIAAAGAKTALIEPGSPWGNGYCESFNAHF